MGRAALLVLDGFGIGAMEDCVRVQPQDIHANTHRHIQEAVHLQIPNLYALGLHKIVNNSGDALGATGMSKLAHYGADTFMGHQELMGSRPGKPELRLMKDVGDTFVRVLTENGYEVTRPIPDASVLMVNQAIIIGDNLESALGNIINIVCDLNQISFDECVEIGKIIRNHIDTSRVIVFGNTKTNIETILSVVQEKHPGQWGVNSPRANVYGEGYQVRHLGMKVRHEEQFQYYAEKQGIPVFRIGKTADVLNGHGYGNPVVDTRAVLQDFKTQFTKMKANEAAFLVNVQETDLAGHAEDVKWYQEVLQIADAFLRDFIPMLEEDDMLIITADHGNDPTIGHSNHTREHTPIIIIGPRIQPVSIGVRETMADIGATFCEYFKLPHPEYGTSFLQEIDGRL